MDERVDALSYSASLGVQPSSVPLHPSRVQHAPRAAPRQRTARGAPRQLRQSSSGPCLRGALASMGLRPAATASLVLAGGDPCHVATLLLLLHFGVHNGVLAGAVQAELTRVGVRHACAPPPRMRILVAPVAQAWSPVPAFSSTPKDAVLCPQVLQQSCVARSQTNIKRRGQ